VAIVPFERKTKMTDRDPGNDGQGDIIERRRISASRSRPYGPALVAVGIGLMLSRTTLTQPWALLGITVGLGALLAILWEIGEYYAFIRNGTELDTAYTDTLGDEVLGCTGAVLAGVWIAIRARPR
jgi:hypothetical protein